MNISARIILSGQFMDQVAQKPSAVALRHRGVDHTYAEIDAWSDHYAARLQGLPRHEPVVILSDRGPELVAAIITMLKAGRGFLPLDPELPIRRLKIMVEEARICSLLTQKKVDHFGTLDLPRVPLELPAVLESRP